MTSVGVPPLPHRRFPCAECPWRRDTAWIGYGTIDETRALDAHTFATRDMHNLAKRVLGDRHLRLDPDESDAARRKHEVVQRYLTDRNLLPAALVDPNWRPTR